MAPVQSHDPESDRQSASPPRDGHHRFGSQHALVVLICRHGPYRIQLAAPYPSGARNAAAVPPSSRRSAPACNASVFPTRLKADASSLRTASERPVSPSPLRSARSQGSARDRLARTPAAADAVRLVQPRGSRPEQLRDWHWCQQLPIVPLLEVDLQQRKEGASTCTQSATSEGQWQADTRSTTAIRGLPNVTATTLPQQQQPASTTGKTFVYLDERGVGGKS